MFILLGNLSRHILIHTEFKPSWNLTKNSRLVEAAALNKGCWLSESTQCLGSDVPLAMFKWSHMTFYCQRITKEYKVSSLFCWTEYRVVLPPPLLYLCPLQQNTDCIFVLFNRTQSGIVSQSETITQSEHIPLLLHEGRRKTEMHLSECKKVAFHVKYMCVFPQNFNFFTVYLL